MSTRTALITGASGGIGMELARLFAEQGVDLVIVARSEDSLNELKEELESVYGISVTVRAADLTRPQAVEDLVELLKERNIRTEYLVNNAGFGDFGPFHRSEWVKQAGMIDLNIRALTHLTHCMLPGMVARGSGRIMNVASTASFQPGPLMSVYYATKHYVLAFSEAIAEEVEDYGLSVTALCPGPTESGFQSAAEMEGSRLVNLLSMPSSRRVAEYGFRAMMKGKRVAVHGLLNKLLAFSVRFTPRRMLTAMVRRLQAPRN